LPQGRSEQKRPRSGAALGPARPLPPSAGGWISVPSLREVAWRAAVTPTAMKTTASPTFAMPVAGVALVTKGHPGLADNQTAAPHPTPPFPPPPTGPPPA